MTNLIKESMALLENSQNSKRLSAFEARHNSTTAQFHGVRAETHEDEGEHKIAMLHHQIASAHYALASEHAVRSGQHSQAVDYSYGSLHHHEQAERLRTAHGIRI